MITKYLGKNEVWVCEGKIVAPKGKPDKTVDLGKLLIAPGYIDLQVNGGYGIDLLKEPERVEELARKLLQEGVIAFLPTLISARLDEYERALPYLQPRRVEGGAEILGVHLEGPFINEVKKGAHLLPEKAKLPSLKGVKLVTLDPEHPKAKEILTLLKRESIVVSVGHTMATTLPKEAQLITHLFNAMGPLHHRKPSLIGELLAEQKVPYSMIADALHVHPTIMKMTYNAHPKGAILISDAMAAMGLSDGNYLLGNQEVTVKNSKATLRDKETLAGATLPLARCVANWQRATSCPLDEAIEAATSRPAKLLGINNRLGTLQPGAEARLITLDSSLSARLLICKS